MRIATLMKSSVAFMPMFPIMQHGGGIEVRQNIHGQYRALYTICGETVYILTIRHGARQLMSGEEVDEL